MSIGPFTFTNLTTNRIIMSKSGIQIQPGEVKVIEAKDLDYGLVFGVDEGFLSVDPPIPEDAKTQARLESELDRDPLWPFIENPDLGGTVDATAIHDDAAGEIAAVAEKASPVDDDILLIEDSEATFVKKKMKLSSLPGGGGGGSEDRGVRVKRTTTDTFTDGVPKLVTWEINDYDTHGAFGIGGPDVLVTASGKWLLHTSIEFADAGVFYNLTTEFLVNGAPQSKQVLYVPTNNLVHHKDILALAVNDIVQVRVTFASGGALSNDTLVITPNIAPLFKMQMLAAS